MAYRTYTTEAVVCGSKNNYTSDRVYLLFTKDAGMLWATARSVRAEKSKQRYALQDFSIIRVSLVRGKNGWRVGSVESAGNPFTEAYTREVRGCVTSIVKLLRRFIHGEEAHPAIFRDVSAALKSSTNIPVGMLDLLRDLFTFRLLNALGYIGNDTTYAPYVDRIDWSNPPKLNPKAEKAVTYALEVSHL